MGSAVQTPCNKESRFMNTRLEVGQAMCLYHSAVKHGLMVGAWLQAKLAAL